MSSKLIYKVPAGVSYGPTSIQLKSDFLETMLNPTQKESLKLIHKQRSSAWI